VGFAVGCVPVVSPPHATRSNAMIHKSKELTMDLFDLEED
jgi:hypothetical protein